MSGTDVELAQVYDSRVVRNGQRRRRTKAEVATTELTRRTTGEEL